jgi:hypothetical protein
MKPPSDPARDTTDELGAASGIKERLRTLLTSDLLAEAHEQDSPGRLGARRGLAPDRPALDHHQHLMGRHRGAGQHRRHQRRTEAGSTTIKQIKRTGRDYRDPATCRTRLLLTRAARTVA